MNAHLSNKRNKIAAALLLISQAGYVSAAEPVFLNNGIQLDELVAVGKHVNAADDVGYGAPSNAAAMQQAIAIDSKNTVYSAYLDKADGKAYVMKLEDNVWVAASLEDVDADSETVGDVSDGELAAAGQANQLIIKNRSLAMAMSSNDEPHIAYATNDNKIVIKKLNIDDAGIATNWQALPEISAENVSFLRFALDSENNPYLFYGGSVGGLAELTLAKLVDGAWVVLGNSGDAARTTTRAMVQGNVILASFALSSDDVPYIAFDSNQLGLTINQLYVQKLDNDGWVTVGARTIHQDVGNIRAVEMTVASDNVPYVVTESFSHRVAVTKFVGETLEDNWTSLGRGINQEFQTQSFSSIPTDMKINVDSEGVPYIVYQDINSRPESRIRVLRLQQITVDGELVDSWQQMDIGSDALSPAESTRHSHRYNDVVFDNYQRPYVVYQDGGTGHDSKSRVLRAQVANNTEAMRFSVLEGTFDVGAFDVESLTDYRLELSGKDAGAFSTEALAEGKLELNSVANFRTPSYSFNVTAINIDDESTGELPVRVSFEDDPDVEAEGFVFEVFECTEKCPINLLENEEIDFTPIKNQIAYFEIEGELPEGIEFSLDDPQQGFTGKPSYSAAGEYPITITAFPTDKYASEQPIELSLVITVTNVPMMVDVADYSIEQGEDVEYNNAPLSSVAVQRFSIEGLPVWAEEFDESLGQIGGTPSFTQAGVYTGTVSAHGFDGELEQYPFVIDVKQVDLELRDEAEQTLIVSEDQLMDFVPDVTAAKYFTVTGKPSWAVFDADLGDVSGRPSFTDEGEYSFTVTAFGFDGEESQSTTVTVQVEHQNAPPTITAFANLTAEESSTISVNVMQYVSDVDSDQYGDSVSLVMGEGNYSHDGLGVLEQVNDGFLYTPAIGDIDTVTVNFTVTDDRIDGAATSAGSFGIDIQVVENKSFEQSSSGGSLGGSLVALFGLMFGFGRFKRNA